MAKIENYGFSKGLKNPFLSLLTISNKSSNVKSCENLNWLKIEKKYFQFQNANDWDSHKMSHNLIYCKLSIMIKKD